MYADLHIHTTASDGVYSPSEVTSLAKNIGYIAIAITDHDSVSGLSEGIAEGEKIGLEVVPGIELSTLLGTIEIHILGYFIDPSNRRLQELLSQFIQARQNRTVSIINKLIDLGYDLSIERVKEIANSEFIGRPHVARALLEKGYINDIADAFTLQLIGKGGKAYVERFKLTPQEGINIIVESGGVPVLAHPGYLSNRSSLGEIIIKQLVESGLKGIEVYYSQHKPEQIENYKKIAEKNNLLITGGSDFHGDEKIPVLGKIKLPYHFVEAIRSIKENTPY